MNYTINGKYVHPYLLARPDIAMHTYCHNCGAIKGTKLVGDVVVCSRCRSFFDRETCERLSKKEAMFKMICGEEEE
jgi:hypothetical protein